MLSFSSNNEDDALLETKSCLRTETTVEFGTKKFQLSMPSSRVSRSEQVSDDVQLGGFQGRVQREYNTCPVGCYAGPYDQNEKLKLSVQLPKSKLDYRSYSEFIHDEKLDCTELVIGQKYLLCDDLSKIDSFEIKEGSIVTHEESDDDDDNEEDKVGYTCFKQKCKIPCPCELCVTGSSQCSKHQMRHPKLFNENNDAICIRSSEERCDNEEFFEVSYINKYSGIPIECQQCEKDLLHHKSYHLNFHYSCKFCQQNWYKLYPKSPLEFKEKQKKEEDYHDTVCPFCDKKFCEPYFAKKHIEYSHQGKAPFQCDVCQAAFQSKQALEYHISKKHSKSARQETCKICQKVFKSKVSLDNHTRYVHSDKRKYSCQDCDSKFKEKKSLRNHNLNVHGIDQYIEKYQQNEEVKRFQCNECERSYQQKKDLNHHRRSKHGSGEGEQIFFCPLCNASFKQKKILNAHMKGKHGPDETFDCPKCGKAFNRKDHMRKHLYRHKFD